jgi:16S rRNA (cytosine967-C5)-methyltransferase
MQSDKRWGSRDRAFIAENTYEIVRWYRLLCFVKGDEDAYQRATVDSDFFWNLLGIWLRLKYADLPQWEEFKNLDWNLLEERLNASKLYKAVDLSIPDWLETTALNDMGERWHNEMLAMNEQADLVVRANTLKIKKGKLKGLLEQQGVESEFVKDNADALQILKRTNLFKLEAFREGLFEVQDAGSQQIAHFTDVSAGMRVIDACAGAGGKTLHLAALMENKGKIIALDVEQWKLDELKRRAKRAGADCIETRCITSNKVIKRLEAYADLLLLDVPCSGLGVLKRNPDAKWKLSEAFLNEVKLKQQKILQEYAQMLKPGGKLIYATCSLLNAENEKQVEHFLNTHPQFKFINDKRIWPSEHNSDGFYMAAMIKS